jgi:hypothetical protein
MTNAALLFSKLLVSFFSFSIIMRSSTLVNDFKKADLDGQFKQPSPPNTQHEGMKPTWAWGQFAPNTKFCNENITTGCFLGYLLYLIN